MTIKCILQSEAAECGIACLAMVMHSHGNNCELSTLRQRFPAGTRGVSLKHVMDSATAVGLAPRALTVSLDELRLLETPCILHWNMNHFVVLLKAGRRTCIILDPAVGQRKLKYDDVSRHFTGVALELTPSESFETKEVLPSVKVSMLIGSVRGLKRAAGEIVLVALVLQVFAVLMPLFNQIIIDDVLVSGDYDLLVVLLAGFSILLLCQASLSVARSWLLIALSQNVTNQWSVQVFSHMLRLPLDFFDKRNLGDIVSRFSSIGAIQRTLTTSAIEALLDGVLAAAALVMMLLYSWQLTLIVLAAVIAYGGLRVVSYSQLRQASSERLTISGREQSHFIESIRAMLPLKLYGREGQRKSAWQNLFVEVQNRDAKTAKLNTIFNTGNSLIFGLENLIVLFWGAKIIVGQVEGQPTLTIGMLFAFVSFKAQFTTKVTALVNYIVDIRMLSLHAERLGDIVLSPAEVDLQPANDLSHVSPSIELKNVSFRYGPTDPWVLRDVSIKISAGECVAITGASGGGKTTLLKIALGLLKPNEGEVLIGGFPLEKLGISNVRRIVGTVMQEDVLLSGSVADNIAFQEHDIDYSRVEDCAQQACIFEDICRMPMGFHTRIGEMGSGLSGGQRQRLLISRALYKRPAIFAFDEATSHLDVENERAIARRLSSLKATRLVVAHRLETLAGAERVLYLREGRIALAPG